ncbi:MAG: hypothetical protein F2717_01935, partial [Actinobacteria bacterium]|nr:hypothetical protein [Actinomycetota bacterium]
MLSEANCRLILFACIEPADSYFSNMVFKYGAQATYYQLISDKYKQSKKVSLKVINKLANTQ